MVLLSGLGFYTVIAIFFIIKNRRDASKVVQSESFNLFFSQLPEDKKAFYQKVAEGKTVTQMFSYVLSWILIGMAICGIASFLSGSNDSTVTNIAVLLLGLTPLTIIANAFWIYPKKIVEAEQRALSIGSASATMKSQRVLAWVVWVFYGLGAVGISLVMVFELLINK